VGSASHKYFEGQDLCAPRGSRLLAIAQEDRKEMMSESLETTISFGAHLDGDLRSTIQVGADGPSERLA
jgi:hypothetical protein